MSFWRTRKEALPSSGHTKTSLVFILGCFFVVIGFFWFVGRYINYPFHREVKFNMVSHPEFIPESNFAKITSIGFDNAVANGYWLGTIQYIGGNAVSSEYKKYLYPLLNLITDLNPYFTRPYIIGQLLLGALDEYHDKITVEEKLGFAKKAELLGLKGVKNLCDAKKIALIDKESDMKKIWTEEKYANPCKDIEIPYYLAYTYYWGLKEPEKAARFYKITSAIKDAPLGSRIMAIIMTGKAGNRETSALSFLTMAEATATKNSENCSLFAQELRDVIIQWLQNEKIFSDSTFLQKVDEFRAQAVKKLGEDGVDFSSVLTPEDLCSANLNKAVRELNLGYLEKNMSKCEKSTEKIRRTKDMIENKCVSWIPTDFQVSEKEKLYMDYYYDPTNKRWDYRMYQTGIE